MISFLGELSIPSFLRLAAIFFACKIKAMQTLGVPYPTGYADIAEADLNLQAKKIAANLKKDGIESSPKKEIIAMIAYLQRMGTDIKKTAITDTLKK